VIVRCAFLVLCAILAGLAVSPSFAQEPPPPPPLQLVRDIRTDAQPSLSGYPQVFQFVELDGELLFPGWDGVHGWELWRTDGTAEGTVLVRDICPGHCSSLPWDLRQLLGAVYFRASDGDHGTELWRTDGTAEGTELVADVAPGADSSLPMSLAELGGEVYFQADDMEHGAELWATDGTPGGLRLVADIRPGAEGSRPLSLIAVGDRLFFSADDGASGREPWKADGTSEGTERLADLCPGAPDSLWEDQDGPWGQRVFGVAGNRLVLSTHDTWTCPPGVWVSDGTTEGTEQIPGLGYALLFPDSAPDGAVLLSAQDAVSDEELWRTDGTVAGTARVADIHPTGSSSPRALGRAGGAVYFSAWDGLTGTELWRTDGTAAGTELVRDIRPGPVSGIWFNYLPTGRAAGESLFFQADDGVHGRELWVTDGTTEGTMLTADINPGAAEPELVLYSVVLPGAVDGRLITMAYAESNEWALWASDGSPEGTELLVDLDTQSSSAPQGWWGLPLGWFSPKAATQHGIVWRADDGERGERLWISDGTPVATRVLADACSECPPGIGHYPHPVTAVGDLAYWWIFEGENRGTWVTDGTAAGTQLLHEDAQAFEIAAWPRAGGTDVLLSGSGLWVSDGTPEGTVELIGFGTWVSEPTPLGEVAFFGTSSADGFEPWVTDGTPEGTMQFTDIQPGPESSNVTGLTAFSGGTLFFWADDGVHGMEPWTSDGTPGGTGLLLDIHTGIEPSLRRSAFAPIAVGDKVYFPADDGLQGTELWVSDGTAQGTFSLGDLNPGARGSAPRPWIAWDGFLFFSAWDVDHGRELWRTDGTPGGTVRIQDFYPGPGSGIVDVSPVGSTFFASLPPIVWNDRLYFAATDGATGVELWSTDGTPGGTGQVADIHPGHGSSSPNGFAIYGDQLFFTATDGVHGYELWALGEPPVPEVVFADGFESGDTSAWATVVP
jgi:ELWxxDGT repeat protein